MTRVRPRGTGAPPGRARARLPPRPPYSGPWAVHGMGCEVPEDRVLQGADVNRAEILVRSRSRRRHGMAVRRRRQVAAAVSGLELGVWALVLINVHLLPQRLKGALAGVGRHEDLPVQVSDQRSLVSAAVQLEFVAIHSVGVARGVLRTCGSTGGFTCGVGGGRMVRQGQRRCHPHRHISRCLCAQPQAVVGRVCDDGTVAGLQVAGWRWSP